MSRALGVLAVAVGLAMATAGAAEEKPFTAFAAQGGSVFVGHAGGDYVRFGLIAWGPRWAWTGVQGKQRSDAGAAVSTLTAKMGRTGVPFRIAFRASAPDPKRLELSYELQSEEDTALTLICVELAPGKAFEGRDVMVESGGKQTPVRCPFERRGLGKDVAAVRMTDAEGRTTLLRFDPPCTIHSDGPARVVLAEGKLAGGEAKKLKISVELPGAMSWFPSVADVPDEPGIRNWYEWRAAGDPAAGALGMQDWIERPAGKHGRIVRQGEKLVYNGKPIKLWGLNLCYSACAPEKELADKRAAFYPKYGINAVRLHKYADGFGWAGIQSKESCVEFDPAALDRMDYQIAKLKEAGIYVKLSAHFGSQKLGPADEKLVPYMREFGAFRSGRIETPHSGVHYSPELQKVQALQMTNLLKHRNPYTGLTYAEDPAIAFIEIINEQSILFYTTLAPLKASETIRKQTGERFCEWLRKKYGTEEKLVAAWGRPAFNSFANEGFKPPEGEGLDKDNILPIGNPWFWDPDQLSGSQKFRRQRLLDSLHFLYELQCEFYLGYVKAVREAGYQGEIVSTNWQAGRAYSHFANLHSDSLVGTIDRHNYSGGRANASMLARAGSGLLSTGMQQVANQPFMFSEWIHVFPNEMGVEGPAIIGAYGLGLQGWDVSFMFQNGDTAAFSQVVGRQPWDVTAPQVLGVFPAVARHIHRGDVKESETLAALNVHVPSLFEGKLGFGDKVIQGYDDKELDNDHVSARALAVARCAVAFTEEFKDTSAFDLAPHTKEGQLVSTTSQLRWKEDRSGGFFTIDTPGTKAVVGFAEGRKCDLGGVTIEPQCRFAAIYVTAREKDKTIEAAGELLVVAIARARNTGMKFSPSGDRMLAKGEPPIVMEPVKARIAIRRAGTLKAIALDHDGKPTEAAIPVADRAFVIDGARDKTPYYLIRCGGPE